MRIPCGAAIFLALPSLLVAQEVTIETAQPVVVRTVPEAGSADVDPKTAEIKVTFSKDMADQSWSVVKASTNTMPNLSGKPRYEKDGRTLILPVKLDAGRDYALWLNTNQFRGFKDRSGLAAVPYLLTFRTRGPRSASIEQTKPDFAAIYDALCDDMARNYSYLQLKTVDWPALRAQYRERAISAKDRAAFLAVLGQMLGNLKDGHVWIKVDGEIRPTFRFPMDTDRTDRLVRIHSLESLQRLGGFAALGTVGPERFGAIVLIRQSLATPDAVKEIVAFVESHADAPGFVIDLRDANGGNEALARSIASSFCGKPTVYAASRFRNGPKPGDFGMTFPRLLPAATSGKAYTKPVVVLIGPGCVSSGEGFAKMLKSLPNVTLVGRNTRGSSGNPSPFELAGLDAEVWYSRWVDLLPDGTPVEGKGIEPHVRVDASESGKDLAWEKALAVLRSKI